MHFFNPAPVMKLVEVVRTVVTEPSVVEDVEALAARLGKIDVTIGDKAGLHRQRAAVRLPQPRRVDVREPLRQPRGHRRRHAAGLRPADGPAGADGPHRHRHRLRDPRHDVQAVAQPAARPEPGHQADDDRRAAGPEVRPRLLHLRRAGTRPRSCADAATPAAGGAAEGARPVRTVGVVGSGTMATGIIEVVAKGGYDVRFVARAPEKVEAVAEGAGQVAGQAGRRAAGSRRPRRDEVLARVTGTTSLDDLADRDLVIEAVVESLAVKEALFANLGEIAKPGAVLATTTSSLPVIECAKASGRPADVVGHALLQPGAGDEAGRGGLAPSPPRPTSPPPRTRSARSSASTRSPAPTGPGSSSTRCCSRTSTTR